MADGSGHEMAVDDAEAAGPGTTETLYLNNLNERVPLSQLKAELWALCAQHGAVRDIVARKSLRKRGQAFVVFDSADSAARALPHLQDREWHSKPVRAAYARTRSDLHVSEQKLRMRRQKRELARKARAGPGTAPASASAAGGPAAARPAASGRSAPVPRGEPHNVLFLEHIPPEVTPEHLQAAFQPVAGFVEARMFKVKHLGFVEFASVEAATAALDHWEANQGAVPDVGRMVFAKK